ncbi:3-deoxy-7-phosphoheptulonate synthase [Candidatus Pacearchaeota archaeon]|nr:MAG: 3-deoxy-7-phosphoheptulonate synthase [Candidatus Pacearchaeota archaeon]
MEPLIIAGPCAVESKEQIEKIASGVSKLGIKFLRGGAFKPRTLPDSFQGLGAIGINFLTESAKKYSLKSVSEVMDTEDLELFREVDVIQIGSRNMFNYSLLKKVAARYPKKPVLLKRGFSAKINEVIGALKYLKKYGHNSDVFVCERGIRTFSDSLRFTFDVGFIAEMKRRFGNKIFILADPSHAAGRKDLVFPLALSGICAGADGLIIEVRLESEPICDAQQAINLKELERLIVASKKVFLDSRI